jgi:hypothetical protein
VYPNDGRLDANHFFSLQTLLCITSLAQQWFARRLTFLWPATASIVTNRFPQMVTIELNVNVAETSACATLSACRDQLCAERDSLAAPIAGSESSDACTAKPMPDPACCTKPAFARRSRRLHLLWWQVGAAAFGDNGLHCGCYQPIHVALIWEDDAR